MMTAQSLQSSLNRQFTPCGAPAQKKRTISGLPAVAIRVRSRARDVERPDLFLKTLSFQSDRRGCASDVAAKFPKLARKILALPLAPRFTIVLQPESRIFLRTVVRALGFHQRNHVL